MEMYNKSTMRYVALLGIVAASSLGVGCYAQDAYTMGSKAAQKRDYKTAAGYFEKVVTASPGNAVAHYQLANCYIQLHRRLEAKNEYEKCLRLNPDPVTQGYCQKMLTALGASQGSSGSAAPAAASDEKAASPPATSALDARKQEILKQAQQQADKIKQEAANQLKEMQQNMSPRVWATMGQAQSQQVTAEAEARAQKLLDQAKDRVDHMHSN